MKKNKEMENKSHYYWDLDRNGRKLSMSDREIMEAKGYNVPKPSKQQQLPDARLHQKISFIKSGVRILGYCLIPFSLVFATILLILSEVIGIIEELV
tara:strand:- start:720 stop:1010 length:291 start_codon:yes stop_codon:yes gene_type:complete